MSRFRCGTVSLAGRPNTGKSTLLNRLVGAKLAGVSPRAQTTRHLIRGIVTTADCQYVFVDSPGLQSAHRGLPHRSLLYQAMNRRAGSALQDSDVVAFVLDASRPAEEDRAVLRRIAPEKRVVAVLNKIDRLGDQALLLPLLASLAKERDFFAMVPVSARTGKNLPELLRVLREALPEQPALFAKDELTDRDERFLASELLREKLFLELGEDLPYRCEVVVDEFKEEGALRRIQMTVFVERESQKAIVIGKEGAQLKRIGAAARRDMERLFGGKVFLGLWVKVRRGWSDDQRVLRQFGHES